MENNEYTLRIHRYLLNGMDAPERAEFEKDMKSNETLSKDVELERRILQGLRMVGETELRQRIETVRDELAQEGFFKQDKSFQSPSKTIFMKKFLAIAAAAAVTLLLGWWFFGKGQAPDPDAAFATYFQPEKTKVKEIIAAMPTGFATPDTLLLALQQYDEGQYDEACATLDSFLLLHPENDTALFYLGMAHLNQSRYAKAVEILTPVSADSNSDFRLDATWYLALCYLKVENGLPRAKELFSELAANADYRDRQSASGILRLLGEK